MLDPLLLTILISGGIFIVSFLIGRESRNYSNEKIIEETIVYLCNEGFVRYSRDENGEIEILKIERNHGSQKNTD